MSPLMITSQVTITDRNINKKRIKKNYLTESRSKILLSASLLLIFWLWRRASPIQNPIHYVCCLCSDVTLDFVVVKESRSYPKPCSLCVLPLSDVTLDFVLVKESRSFKTLSLAVMILLCDVIFDSLVIKSRSTHSPFTSYDGCSKVYLKTWHFVVVTKCPPIKNNRL